MQTATNSSLSPFFDPQGVVVIGVSMNPAKLGYAIAQNLVGCGYQGAIHFVNPKGGMLFERPVYAAVSQVPGPVDLAVLLVPAAVVPAALQMCGEQGVRAAIIASGGFREVGPEGAKLEAACLTIAQQYGMRLMGPNCIGLMDTHLPLDTTFLPPPAPAAGDIAFISHSGAICAAIVDWSRGQGFGFSRLVSLGNQADVTETDLLAPVADDEHTRVVTLYLEGVRDGRRFVEIARQVTQHKPVLALKVGRTGGGKKAAASHTGALAGEEAAYDAAFRRAGIQRAQTAEEMFDWAQALARCPLPQGRHVAVLTNAGGPGVMAADALEAEGLLLASLSEYTHRILCEALPEAASVTNPVDMLATATPEQYAASLRLLLADENVHAVLLILPPPPMFSAETVAQQIMPIIQTAEKPVVIALMGHSLIQEAQTHFRAAKIPIYPFPERAASAMAALAQRASYLAQAEPEPVVTVGTNAERGRRLLAAAEPGWLPQELIKQLLHAYGISVPAMALARTATEAGVMAARIGFPVAMKIISPDIVHKSDAGGIILNLADAAAVEHACAQMMAHVLETHPEAELTGVQVQQMVPGGQEVIAGVTRDPQFGPLIMFGSGGVEVEGLQDVAFELAPLTRGAARRLLHETWAGKKLAGYRNIPPADETKTLDMLIRLGQMAHDLPPLAEIEINPLLLLAEGATAVDVRARLAEQIVCV
jgi:acetyltransferase